MTFVTLLFTTRKPTLTPSQFKEHYETKHIPLINSLLGPVAPLHHRRWYISQTQSDSSETPNFVPLVLRGTPEFLDYDCIAEVSWEDEKTFQECGLKMMDESIASKLEADEEAFIVREKMRVVVIGETTESTRGST